MGFLDAGINVSNQQTTQVNENIQEDLQSIRNDNKVENIQDYVTYIRTTNRNTNDLKNTVKSVMNTVSDLIAENETAIDGCATFNGDFNNEQIANVDNKIEKGIEALQDTAEQIKQQTEQSSSTSSTVDQTGSSAQSADASSKQGNEQEQKDSQSVEQSSFTYLGRISPFKMLEGFNGLLKIGRANRRKETFLSFQANLSNQTTEQTNSNRQTSQKFLDNNSEIANKISNAYDKVSEVLNEFRSQNEKVAEINTEAKTRASNKTKIGVDPRQLAELAKLGIDPTKCLVFNGDVNINQKIEATNSLVLKGVISQMSKADVDAETAAIMADMMGLTQGASTDQSSSAKSDQTSTQKQAAEKTASQTGPGLISSIIGIVVLYFIYKSLRLGMPSWFKKGNMSPPTKNVRN